MKFFVPKSENEEQAERVYSAIAEFIGVSVVESNKRIYSITYKHNGQNMVATVGEKCDPYYQDPYPLVVAIFKGNPYKICLKDRGVAKGEPIFVGLGNILTESTFE